MARASRQSSSRREHNRRGHRSTDSNGELLPRSRAPYHESPSPSPTKSRPKRTHKSYHVEESDVSKSTSNALSAGSLAQLDALNDKLGWTEYDDTRPKRREERTYDDYEEDKQRRERRAKREQRRRELGEDHNHHRERKEERREHRQRRVVSGPTLERGNHYYSEKIETDEHRTRLRGGTASEDYDEEARRRKRRRIFFIAIAIAVVLIIAISVGIVVSKKKSTNDSSSTGGAANSTTTKPSNSNLAGISESSIPTSAQGTILDPFTWYDTTDFNVTYTAETVGGLSVMGLNSSWDDSTRANDNVPALNGTWTYGTMPIRGVNLGGWLSIEPIITPSLFDSYTTHDNVIDEYTLSSKLGASKAKSTLEEHYSSFVNEMTFSDIQAAGFDHVRIPFSYWAVTTYDGDPYVPQVSWRYLLRGIEWARKYGLRINLDLHGAPGSQNGWNHSGRQGSIGWLNGTDGATNAQRTLDIHTQLSTFFAQPRYKNIIGLYGLVNEPRMVELDVTDVMTWTKSAIELVRKNGITAIIVFGDGFLGLDNWQGKLQDIDDILLDVHQYVIFNVDQIALDHKDKTNFACGGWTQQTLRSMNTATGFGPTLCGEWSQADTDCAQYLNNVGVGSRWEGTLNMINTPGGSDNGSVLTPVCPTANNPQCSCTNANADASAYSAEYKQWLLQFAEAQMTSFENGWGWFYWTWQTETATQWSYKAGLAAGTLPAKTWDRTFNCSSIPDYAALGLPEYY